MSYAPWYLHANKLKYTFGADADLVVGEVVEDRGHGHVIHIRTNNGDKAVALQSIVAQPPVGNLHVHVTHLDGTPYIAVLPPPTSPDQLVDRISKALNGNPNFITAKVVAGPKSAAGLVFSKTIIQFPYSGLGEPPFTLFNGIVADVFKDVIHNYKEFAVLYGTTQ